MAGIVLVAWTMAHLGKNLTDTVVTRSNATLVTSGPYRWVRHPFYICAALLILAGTLLSANLLMAVAGGSVLAMIAVRTPREEQKLIDAFGDDYRAYMRRPLDTGSLASAAPKDRPRTARRSAVFHP